MFPDSRFSDRNCIFHFNLFSRSRRHDDVVTMSYLSTDFRSNIVEMLNSSFLPDQTQINEQLRRVTSDIFDDFMTNRQLSFLLEPDVFKKAYLKFVLEPEGLVYLLMTRDMLNRQNAEKVISLSHHKEHLHTRPLIREA